MRDTRIEAAARAIEALIGRERTLSSERVARVALEAADAISRPPDAISDAVRLERIRFCWLRLIDDPNLQVADPNTTLFHVWNDLAKAIGVRA